MYRESFLCIFLSFYYLPSHSWDIVSGDEEWAICAVMESFPFLPFLTDFRLHIVTELNFVLPLHLLSGLRRITINGGCIGFHKKVVLPLAQAISRSPELSYLEVDWNTTWNKKETPSLNGLLSYNASGSGLPLRQLSLKSWDTCLDNVPLSHFKSLKSFTLRNYRGYDKITDSRCLWKAFLIGGIILEELNVDEVSSEVMDFIASFSGLQRLTLLRLGSETREASDNMADFFFRHVLPMHRSTLHSLTLEVAYEGKWCFSEANATVILDCQTLNGLSVALWWEDYEAENDGRSPVVGQFFLVMHALLMPCSIYSSTMLLNF
jgi:hypothetical protein